MLRAFCIAFVFAVLPGMVIMFIDWRYRRTTTREWFREWSGLR